MIRLITFLFLLSNPILAFCQMKNLPFYDCRFISSETCFYNFLSGDTSFTLEKHRSGFQVFKKNTKAILLFVSFDSTNLFTGMALNLKDYPFPHETETYVREIIVSNSIEEAAAWVIAAESLSQLRGGYSKKSFNIID